MGTDEPDNLVDLHIPDVDKVVAELKTECLRMWQNSMNMPVALEGFYGLVLQAIRAVYAGDNEGAELTDVINWNGDEGAKLEVVVYTLPMNFPEEMWFDGIAGGLDLESLRALAKNTRNMFENEKENRGIAGSLRFTKGKLIWIAEAPND